MLQDMRADSRARVRQSKRDGIVGWYIMIFGATLMPISQFDIYGFADWKSWAMSAVYVCFLGIAIISIRQKKKILKQFSD